MGLAAWNKPVVVFVVSFAVLIVLDLAACSWIERKWDAWVAGSRVEARSQKKIRSGKRATPDRVDDPRFRLVVRFWRQPCSTRFRSSRSRGSSPGVERVNVAS
jgi:hypothetical protein